MLEYDELRLKLLELKPQIEDLADAIGLEALQEELDELHQKAAAPNFWNDMENSSKVLQRTRQIENKIEAYKNLSVQCEDALTMIEIANEEKDLSVLSEITESVKNIETDLEKEKLSTLLTGEYDANNAILTFHAGAGGTESQDWAQMLYRMYTRWSERHGFKYRILDYLEGDEAGLKSASILVEGLNAYGFLKSEAGVHRLVRISPFDSAGRRHTSFSSLDVMPELPDDADVEINEEDIRMEVYRSSGAGGQKVNKTSSAVRLIHIPTGIVVSCQNERSQFQNKDMCMKMLRAKLVEIKEREHLEKISDIRGDHSVIAWGSQIRSYVFMPYTLAKDHRTGFENGNIQAVMDGDLDGFINAYLKAASQGELNKQSS
ncbi:peptide chain release factor 2 [Hydrogenoanaerobacterium saccharovorans]|uniref:Peptide chain release factor 2 n=1 Tax=Hydrogenoanaerobacterium saccharovorans TaxID=474960 RepID=A0A1H7ZXJ9_9FIRM|nr:peptide chain release factor 2 [Hydrogenoanaerobacterium saccharovorans]RPF48357.1 peptide chain release factor 2 [Hydrogenoanaerobacterium saccharovorans]SEM62318.1 peptide chain release factor 2 [Hydrogenoanaerobacterium saccharovorans]